MSTRFVWNTEKAAQNKAKHGISFDQAIQAFDDPDALFIEDRRHSDGETRENIIGATDEGGIVLVVFTEREKDVLRVISAREATKKERMRYENNEAPD